MTDIYTKKYENVADPRLGRHVEHDPRSKAYRAVVSPETVEIKSVKWPRQVDVFNQLNLGSCTGNAGVGSLGTTPFYEGVLSAIGALGITLDEDEAVKVYSAATKVDSVDGEYPPDDTGSSGLAVAKVLKSLGLVSGYTHTFSFEELLAALQNGPVMIGVDWYNNFFTPDAQGNVTIGENDYVAGGHEFVIDEVDVENKRLGATNSWGADWGLSGRFYLSYELAEKLLTSDGDVTVLVPLTQPAPQPVVPSPSPEPTAEVVTESDRVLWQTVQEWAVKRHSGLNRTASQAALSWAKKKGLTTS